MGATYCPHLIVIVNIIYLGGVATANTGDTEKPEGNMGSILNHMSAALAVSLCVQGGFYLYCLETLAR